MKTILCYGDSNTWGADPVSGGRFDRFTRWAGVLRTTLNAPYPPGEPEYWINEEGLNGRTTCREDPVEPHRNGIAVLPAMLLTHKPIDLAIIMLGTNDLKVRFAPTAQDIAKGAQRLGSIVQASDCGPGGRAPKLLLVCPAPVARLSFFKEMFAGAEEISQRLNARYRQCAAEIGAEYLNAGDYVHSSDADGIHLDPDQHALLGKAIADRVKAMLG